jgi:hypothetical protein
LAGARATIGRCRPILLVEHIKVDVNELAALLSSWGYEVRGAGINLLAIHADDPCRVRMEKGE